MLDGAQGGATVSPLESSARWPRSDVRWYEPEGALSSTTSHHTQYHAVFQRAVVQAAGVAELVVLGSWRSRGRARGRAHPLTSELAFATICPFRRAPFSGSRGSSSRSREAQGQSVTCPVLRRDR